ncbi:restriction endonuclease subunit S [Salmonella enterica]|nr:restriction endonuclease subunit S [Salmonella enterica]EEH5302011.1 restriction endonuclease subunit S [Salmonella enterica]EGF0385794.1 restriction endonuclease subunit S [Salmonella enterica]EGV9482369.1 restriction endonuclease subunit S [Salmonella enterica]EIN3808938.1 restriction endonuclease subunit S [Salmonella enterica]
MVKTIGDACNIRTGKLDANRAVKDGDYPFFTCAEFPEKIDHYAFDGDVVLIAGNNARGNFHVSRYQGKFNAYQRTYVLTAKPGYDIDYIYYALKLELQRLREKAQGSQTKFLTMPILTSISLRDLVESEQSTVSKILKIMDKKIALNNRINSELEAMAKMLYDYWFVQFDFPDGNGKPYKVSGGKMEYNAKLKREIPAGWTVQTLPQIANITMGQSPAGESYNEDGIGTLFFQGSTDFGWLFPTPRQYTISPARMAKKGDILLSVRAPVGNMNIANADCCIGRGLAALNSKSGSDGFLFYVMKYFKQVFDRRNAEGTTFGSMTKDDLHSLQVVCPEPELLKRYDGIVSEYNKMIFTRSLENQDLIKLRDWLLPLLMNGQVTVK